LHFASSLNACHIHGAVLRFDQMTLRIFFANSGGARLNFRLNSPSNCCLSFQ
jgi:hypothetical protein